MNTKSLCIILDPAHGNDVKGKCSPDGTHKEYLWSREICKKLASKLDTLGYEVHFTTQGLKEPGLSKRKLEANSIPTSNVKLLISLHNNAAGDGSNWYTASGVEIYTSPGKTQSDIFSSMMYGQLKKDFPKLKFRYGSPDIHDCDKDANFTVLMGNYYAMLIEWLFQDNREEVSMLKDEKVNNALCESLIKGIELINEYVYEELKK